MNGLAGCELVVNEWEDEFLDCCTPGNRTECNIINQRESWNEKGTIEEGGFVANSSCSEFADAGYHCVPYYQCDTCSTIIVDGSSLFDPRSSCGTSKETLWQSAVTNTLPTVSR